MAGRFARADARSSHTDSPTSRPIRPLHPQKPNHVAGGLLLGKPLEGGCVGKVIESLNADFAVGDYVLGSLGWREKWKSTGEGVSLVDSKLAPVQTFLGVLGMTGMTAWAGLTRVARLKSGSTVFVSAASGAVGSVVCQIAKLMDCRVIGSAGNAKKIAWLREKAHVDEVFNYNETEDLSGELGALAPNGIDVYFDNVGGEHLEAALDHMNIHGVVVSCGMISTYNSTEPVPAPRNLFKIIGKRVRIEGMLVSDFLDQQYAFLNDMSGWIKSNALVWEETVTDGLENAPKAFIGLFKGDNMGKSLVRIA
ncbi:MAG: NADP-dependent oxidoreductase [Planctomycetaceae bacterium]|nr:NADP-dependent oxidoreductase [Planctomycetaceae bacterium]